MMRNDIDNPSDSMPYQSNDFYNALENAFTLASFSGKDQ